MRRFVSSFIYRVTYKKRGKGRKFYNSWFLLKLLLLFLLLLSWTNVWNFETKKYERIVINNAWYHVSNWTFHNLSFLESMKRDWKEKYWKTITIKNINSPCNQNSRVGWLSSYFSPLSSNDFPKSWFSNETGDFRDKRNVCVMPAAICPRTKHETISCILGENRSIRQLSMESLPARIRHCHPRATLARAFVASDPQMVDALLIPL